MKMNKSRSFFRLGTFSAGSLYIFGDLGDFSSFAKAVARWTDGTPRNGIAVVIETIPQVRYGVEYGYRKVVYGLDGTVVA